jgi:hypothetical protein
MRGQLSRKQFRLCKKARFCKVFYLENCAKYGLESGVGTVTETGTEAFVNLDPELH